MYYQAPNQVPTPPPNVVFRPYPERKRRSVIGLVISMLILLLIIVGFIGWRASFQEYSVSGSAMQPTLHDGQTIWVNRLAYLFHGPQRDDVVVFHEVDPVNNLCSLDLPLQQTIIVKRIVGIPGDIITNTATSLSVNGKVLYTTSAGNNFVPFANLTLGPDQYFVLGDNPAVSLDSRCLGPIALNTIVGPVM